MAFSRKWICPDAACWSCRPVLKQCCHLPRLLISSNGHLQVIAEVSMEQDDDADYDRKLSQLRREEELINEEAKEAAAFLQTDIPVLVPGQVCVVLLC